MHYEKSDFLLSTEDVKSDDVLLFLQLLRGWSLELCGRVQITVIYHTHIMLVGAGVGQVVQPGEFVHHCFLLSQDLGRSVCVWMICLSLFFIGSGEKDILSLSWWSFGGEHLFVCKSRSLLYPLVINIVAVTVCFSSHWCFQVNFSYLDSETLLFVSLSSEGVEEGNQLSGV